MNPYRICLGCGVLEYSMIAEKCTKCGHSYISTVKSTENLNQIEVND